MAVYWVHALLVVELNWSGEVARYQFPGFGTMSKSSVFSVLALNHVEGKERYIRRNPESDANQVMGRAVDFCRLLTSDHISRPRSRLLGLTYLDC